jgi:hypothetical protein
LSSEALLAGLIFDDRGNRMSPTYAGRRASSTGTTCHPRCSTGGQAGSVARVPAVEIETAVIRSVRGHLKLKPAINDRMLVEAHIARVDVQSDRLVVRLTRAEGRDNRTAKATNELSIPWQKASSRRHREILLPEGTSAQQVRRIRSENRATLVASIARGRSWLNELVTDDTATAERIAEREKCSVRKVNMTISLAFLAPVLVKAAIEGRLPHGMGVARFADLPAEWSRQRQVLGLAPQ